MLRVIKAWLARASKIVTYLPAGIGTRERLQLVSKSILRHLFRLESVSQACLSEGGCLSNELPLHHDKTVEKAE